MSDEYGKIKREIDSYRFPKGEDNPVATYKAVETALEVVDIVENNKLPAPVSFYADSNFGVTFLWENSNNKLFVQCDRDGKVSVNKENEEPSVAEDVFPLLRSVVASFTASNVKV